jgi:hypothetical protein
MTRNDQVLELLYGAFEEGPDALGQALVQFRPDLTPELAEQASRQYCAAMRRQDPGQAIAASTIASRIFNFLGRREEAFNALVDNFSVFYMLAQTEKAYADINTALRQVLSSDRYGNGSSLTALRAWVLAADCAFFACEAATDETSKQYWLQTALDSLLHGATYLADENTSVLIPNYLSTTVAVYRRCLNSGWVGKAWAAAGLAHLTAALDLTVPCKVDYPGKDAKTANVDDARVEMSAIYNHGAYASDRTPGRELSALFRRKSS